jgi:hypothetical protein
MGEGIQGILVEEGDPTALEGSYGTRDRLHQKHLCTGLWVCTTAYALLGPWVWDYGLSLSPSLAWFWVGVRDLMGSVSLGSS